jgi:hypothetical protein
MASAVGVSGGVTLLGWHVQPGEQADGLVAVEVVDVAAPLLVEELQSEQAEQGGGSRDHLGSGVAGLGDQPIKAELRQQRQEQEQAGGAAAQVASRGEGE